ncbi:MAG: hypothetical protein QMC81_05600 [Thermoanaerobacterales bacterium]|nr:hypothetical protein [Bacillota bacterium]MDI6906947.1 hypothetical protein [Thermoanaerobacterales bacterium]
MQVPRWLFLLTVAAALVLGLEVEYHWHVVGPMGAVLARAAGTAWLQQIFLVAVGVVAGLAVGLVLFSRRAGVSREANPPRWPEPRGGEIEREELRRKIRASRGS